jgi:hypothetical protein
MPKTDRTLFIDTRQTDVLQNLQRLARVRSRGQSISRAKIVQTKVLSNAAPLVFSLRSVRVT